MQVVVVGGGAAGMICAHYLAKNHHVTVLEREPVLGGNIRTLNGNIATAYLPPDLFIDNGVIEFHRDSSPALQEVLQDLGLALEPVDGGSTALYLENKQSFHMPGAIRARSFSRAEKLRNYLRLAGILRYLPLIRYRMHRQSHGSDQGVGAVLRNDPMSNWIRMLLMYGYSIPFKKIDQLPARLAIPTLLQGSIGTHWARLPGGAYSYIQKIVDRADPRLTILTGKSIKSVTRCETGVEVNCGDISLSADKVVIATPPDQVLKLLGDPSAHESELFSSWRENRISTVIHTDTSLYARWGSTSYTEFDMFEKSGGDAGYNAYLNRLCGLSDEHPINYFLAYNLEERINPDRILHTQQHRTPLYTTESYRSIEAIKTLNGTKNTYFVGAYLYNGLHEGAAQSAIATRDLMLG
jgi:predicted NAD/FAD-binding protein